MGRIAWYKRDPSAALRGMRLLTPEQRGIYNTVLDLIYDSANELVDDDRFVAGNCNCDIRVYRRVKKSLIEAGKIYIEAGCIHNSTADEVVVECLDRVESSRNAALAKHKKAKAENEDRGLATGIANGVGKPELSDSYRPMSDDDLFENNELDCAAAHAKVLPYKSKSKKDSESDRDSESNKPKTESDTKAAPNGANGRQYVFEGKLFRLTSKDFKQWQEAYSHIDLMAELFNLDSHYDRTLEGDDRKNIYHRMSGAIRKRNLKAMQEEKANPVVTGQRKRLELF